MKNKISTLIALFLISLGVTAQIDRSQQPKAGPAPKINLGKPQTFELKNGLKVLVVENHKLPKVNATLLLDNGPIFEGEKAGVSSIASGMFGNGTTSIPKDAFNEEIDFLGASLNIGSQRASFNTLSRNFPRILQLMADAIQNPLFEQDEFEKQQKQLITGIESNENNVAAVAGKVQNALTFGLNHPNGEFATKESVENVSIDDVKKFYKNYFIPNNGYLVIIGDVKFKEVKKLVSKHFSKWEAGTLPAYSIPKVENVTSTQIDFVDMPNAVQSNIAVLNTIDLKMSNPDYFAVLLANKIYGGGAEGRLFLNLREDKSYTYGAYSSVSTNQRTAAVFKSSATVRNMVTDSSVVEFIKEINKIRDFKASEEELNLAKAAYSGGFIMALENPSIPSTFALNIVINDLSEDFYETYLQKINNVTIDDIQRVAQKYFSADQARIIIVGKALDVLPNLEKQAYPINYYDINANKIGKPELTKPIPNGVTKETVLNNYLESVGGIEKINTIKTVYNKSGATVQGMELSMETKSMVPNKQSVIMSGMGMILSKMIFDGEKGFSEQQGNKTNLEGETLQKMKENKVPFPEVDYITSDGVTLENIEPINGSDAYMVQVGDDTKIFYDVKTGLKLKQVTEVEAMGQTMTQTIDFGDYKEVNGVKFPHSYKMTAGPQQFEFITTELIINEGVSESDFE